MKLYNTLGMISNSQTTPKGKEKPSYLKRGFLGTTLWSIWVHPPQVLRRTHLEYLPILVASPFQESITSESKERFRSSVET